MHGRLRQCPANPCPFLGENPLHTGAMPLNFAKLNCAACTAQFARLLGTSCALNWACFPHSPSMSRLALQSGSSRISCAKRLRVGKTTAVSTLEARPRCGATGWSSQRRTRSSFASSDARSSSPPQHITRLAPPERSSGRRVAEQPERAAERRLAFSRGI